MAFDLELLANFDRDEGAVYGTASAVCGDSRQADNLVEPESVDFLITSPPYPGDVEYTRLFRLEMHFLDFVKDMKDVQAIKRTMVRGSPKSIFKEDSNQRFVEGLHLVSDVSTKVAERVAGKNWGWDYPRLVREYFGDMYMALRAFLTTLKPGATALFVVGDQTVKGVSIPTGEILKQIGKQLGYSNAELEHYRYRRASTHQMPLAENIVVLRK